MKIALFISSLHTGGTQRQISVLADGLARRGESVHLLSIYPEGEFWDQAEENGRITLQALYSARPRLRILRALGLFWSPVRLRRFLQAARPDVVYSMLDLSNLIARLAVIGAWRQFLVWGYRATVRQDDYRVELPYRLCRALSGKVPLAIANSRKGLDVYRGDGFRVASGAVVHNGIDTDHFQFDAVGRERVRKKWGVLDKHRVIGLFGRLDPRKGHGVFIDMAARLQSADENLRFVCVGPGSDAMRSSLLDKALASGLGDSLQFYGETDAMPAAYSGADLIVSASTGEGFPNVVGEAMACGRACVVTDVGDSAILVGDCGIVAPPGDAAALAAAVTEALPQLDELGQCGRSRVNEEFSVAAMVSKTQAVLQSAPAGDR